MKLMKLEAYETWEPSKKGRQNIRQLCVFMFCMPHTLCSFTYVRLYMNLTPLTRTTQAGVIPSCLTVHRRTSLSTQKLRKVAIGSKCKWHFCFFYLFFAPFIFLLFVSLFYARTFIHLSNDPCSSHHFFVLLIARILHPVFTTPTIGVWGFSCPTLKSLDKLLKTYYANTKQ